MATTYDFMIHKLATPEQQQSFMSNPNAMYDLYHLTPTDSHELYDLINPEKNPKLSQEGKVVFLTGASRGIGRSIALNFAKANAKAIILTARSLKLLEQVEKEIHDAYPNTEVLVHQTDVTSESDVAAAFAKAKESFGVIDIAIHNAGINFDTKPLAQTETDDWWKGYEVHIKGLYFVSKQFLLNLGEKSGTLINVSSSSSIGAVPNQTSYGPSKHAANRVIETLHYEYPNVRFFNLHPGVVDTEMTKYHNVNNYGWVMDSPDLAGGTALFLTTPDAEFLRGRWISANWKVDELKGMEQKIVGEHLLVSALNAKLGL